MLPDGGEGFEGTPNSSFFQNFRNFVGNAFKKWEDSGGSHLVLRRGRSNRRMKSLRLSKSFEYLLVRIPVESENMTKVRKLMVNVVIITNAKGPQGEGP